MASSVAPTCTASTASKGSTTEIMAACILKVVILWLMAVFAISQTSLSARMYNVAIVHMTAPWYKEVLVRLAPQTVLLDVGIGTAGALLENRDIVREKELIVFGIDVQPAYVSQANRAIGRCNDANKNNEEDALQVQAASHSIYSVQAIQQWLQTTKVNAVYFSGSFSLLPDPVQALEAAQEVLLRNDNGGTIYITQTYASASTSRFGRMVKPLIRYFTTIDFGKFVSNADALQVFANSNLTQVSHEQLAQQNAFFGLSPPAYLSILKVEPPLSLDEQDSRTCHNEQQQQEG